MPRIYLILTAVCVLGLAFAGCATAPDDNTSPTVTSTGGSAPTTTTDGTGGSTMTTPPTTMAGTGGTMTTPTTPVSPCEGTPTDDGLACTTWTCVGTTWTNVTNCDSGYACTNNGCVQVNPTPVPTPTPTPNPCGDGVCNNGETTATCAMDCPAPPAPPTPIVHRPTLNCSSVVDGQYTISLTGIYLPDFNYPVASFPGGLVTNVGDPGYIQYNSDWDRGTDASGNRIKVPGTWNTPYQTGKAMWAYQGEGESATTSLVVPMEMDSFTLYLTNVAKTGGSWFQNDKWNIGGSCHFCNATAKDKICHD